MWKYDDVARVFLFRRQLFGVSQTNAGITPGGPNFFGGVVSWDTTTPKNRWKGPMCPDLRVLICTFQFHLTLTTKDLPAFAAFFKIHPNFPASPPTSYSYAVQWLKLSWRRTFQKVSQWKKSQFDGMLKTKSWMNFYKFWFYCICKWLRLIFSITRQQLYFQ